MDTGWKRNVVLFLGSQTLSLLGTSLVQYAIFWYITLTTQSGAAMTVYIICGFLPTFFLSPFAGVWADRFSRRRLIAASDAAIAAATLVLALLFMAGYDSLWLLYVMAAVRAAGSGVQGPAVSALIPDIVPQEQLTRVNGANSSIQAIVTLVSPMLSGALFSQAPLAAIFLIDVATAAAAIAILLALVRTPVHAKAREAQATSYFADLAEGFRYIAGRAYIKAFFAFCALFFVLSAPVSFLTPLQVARTFGDDIWYLTAIEVGFSVGMILGGALTAAWGGLRNRVHTMALATLLFGACTFALGVVRDFRVYLAIMGLSGITMPLFNTPATVLLQENVDENMLGRVFGVMNMLASAMMPLGMLVFGPLADLIRIEAMLVATGILMALQGVLLLSNRVLVRAGVRAT
ncbi:MFS transporter [Symbiobacterium thermophilum]|uniref:MFS transporter n=1 Tax=Symbiobacterium thermophilum TaxID=2734 RepID=UPI0023568424|nr:MFS transporter [Symbiobacterium thermophilum]